MVRQTQMRSRNKERGLVMNIGTVSIFVVFIGLCLGILAVLSLSSARNDYRLSQKLASHNREYYQALNELERQLADTKALAEQYGNQETFLLEVKMNEYQSLQATIQATAASDGEERSYKMTACQTIYTQDWEGEEHLPVWQ